MHKVPDFPSFLCQRQSHVCSKSIFGDGLSIWLKRVCVLTRIFFPQNSFTGTRQPDWKVPNTRGGLFAFSTRELGRSYKAQLHWNNQTYTNTGKVVQPLGNRNTIFQFAASLLATTTQSLLLPHFASLSPHAAVDREHQPLS